MRVIIGADAGGFELKEAIREALIADGHEVVDVTPEAAMFYDAAKMVARGVQSGKCERGIVLCGTGMGVSIICNKFRGVYAALCESWYQARRSRTVNNANVLCMGGMLIGKKLGADIAAMWVKTKHLEGYSADEARLLSKDFEALLDVERELFD